MRTPIRGFLSVFTLVSRIPIGFKEEPDYSNADFFLPVVGSIAGIVAAASYSIADLLFSGPIPPAVISIVVQYLAFNLFHFDGLLDSADALLPFAAKEKRMAILKDPTCGSFAVFSGIIIIVGRIGALAEPDISIVAALLAAPVVGRFAATIVPLVSHPAKENGLGALMKSFKAQKAVAGYCTAALPATVAAAVSGGFGASFLIMLCGAVVAIAIGLSVGFRYARLIGGFTGDALGAAVELGELVFLLTYAAGFALL